jgi:hypothetical protein
MAGISERNVAAVTHSLKGMDFPARKSELVNHARDHGADQEIINVLENLPDREFGNMADVMKGYGEE